MAIGGADPVITPAARVLKDIRYSFPWLRHVFADGGYAGDKLK